jgi:hypothetical protein
LTAVLIEERLELGTGWLIDDILSERCWKGGHKRSISGGPPTRKVPLIGIRVFNRAIRTSVG